MQICCSTNVEAAKYLGTLFAFISGFGCMKYFDQGHRGTEGRHFIEYIIIGIIGVLIHGLLVFGALMRKAKVFSAYIVLAIIFNLINFVLLCWAYSDEVNRYP